MLNNFGWGEMAVLVVIALFIFGPDRLPSAITEARKMLQTLRSLANNARNDLTSELGPEFRDLDLAELNPKTFVRKHLWDDDPIDRKPEGPSASDPVISKPLEAGEPAPYDSDAT